MMSNSTQAPETSWRKTTQFLMPEQWEGTEPGHPDVYPAFKIDDGKIASGFEAIAQQFAGLKGNLVIDGFGGVLWEQFAENLAQAFAAQGVTVKCQSVTEALKDEATIDEMIEPFLGGNDPVWGTRFTGQLRDFFDDAKLAALKPDASATLTILYGPGAALAGWDGPLAYVDLPKNEIQFRSRSGALTNFGASQPQPPKPMYKRFYFVDWVAFNTHKQQLLERIDWIIDEQRPGTPVMMRGEDLRTGLKAMSENFFRVRPWFEPGPWGGQWIKERMPALNQDAVNYAWSFELIVPENGLVFESAGRRLEVSFDMLMYQDARAIIGRHAERFGYEFPIRFDFLDTFDGGNLSVQCHPRPEYIKKHFGETFTQDETYYILDCGDDAEVYLGFKEDIDKEAFRDALETSFKEASPVDIKRFVNTESAKRHDLFLIPNGTIHCSGKDNLVLEISATPYIFTFKMYDWMRLDLDGKPRPINIDRAFDNLYFERKGKERVAKELISQQYEKSRGEGWRLIHCPTHAEHFYDVYRYEFTGEIACDTEGKSCHVMMLVEGKSLILETANGLRQRFNFAETFVVPAAAGSYRLINEGESEAKVVQSFIKDV